ncbi:TetR/AcrR family transcriptional regulator [Streptosporangium sp. NBC_01755]|uniref:TetR/AcrR family transcriptional regulator n=1 Tax=unclassified Streptosporangium TaxID=2632669 RepID=UPI002DDC07CB|nr:MULTISPECIES: TetR/AcrR family transcriptional regulator [unclassified Streptosporangium]WSA25879.1 TetR/AcrR family transcriptional regulator [Streptosporangium sp. NBC_01810]WSD02728.1 TetR/AcrR family transcriptional regulator [Streptosporangium sp. NBC_01755]
MKNIEPAQSATPGPTRRRNRRGEGSKLRDEIIAATVELLDEEGDERAITLRSVARRIGIAAPSIYPHFPDQPAIMLAVVRQEYDQLATALRAAATGGGPDPRQRLLAACRAYLDLAQTHPGRYRIMFGGLWLPNLSEGSVTEEDMIGLGMEALQVFIDALDDCVSAGQATSTDLFSDAVALWLGLHGLAHQRAVLRSFPWPENIAERIIGALAHLKDT